MENVTTSDRLMKVIKKLSIQNLENEKRVEELEIINKELIIQHEEKDKCAEELSLANIKLTKHAEEKEKCAEDLTIANNELITRNDEKEKRVKDLEEMLFIISHLERKHITRILGLSNLIARGGNTPEELEKEIGHIKESAVALDEYTRTMTKFIENLLPPTMEYNEHSQ